MPVIKRKHVNNTDLRKGGWIQLLSFKYARFRTPSSDCNKKSELIYLVFKGIIVEKNDGNKFIAVNNYSVGP